MVRRIIFSILILTGAFAGFSMAHPVVASAQADPDPDPTDTPEPTPTPTPRYRDLDFVNHDPAVPDGSSIAVLNGFGEAATDGSEFYSCLSFRNDAPQAAKAVYFEMVAFENGNPIGTVSLTRVGTFSTGVTISDDGGFIFHNRDAIKNCVDLASGSLLFDVNDVDAVGYRISRVDYTDGTSWSSPPLPSIP